MTLSGEQMHALVFLAKTTRPRGSTAWDEAGIAANVRKLTDAGLSAQEVIDRTLRHAWDPRAKTPGVLCGPAPSGTLDANRSNPAVYPVRAGAPEECPLHPGQRATSCSPCAGDRLAGMSEPFVPRQDPPSYDGEGHRLRHRPLRELVTEYANPEENE